ncbi:MAG: type I restriction endonuclease subunit R, partial [Armatimonadetes bacterium]|nr:type I restriction endonuclease subunit R [Armatimonadota bacterium]
MTESEVEAVSLDWLQALGYVILHGPDISDGDMVSERGSLAEVILPNRLRAAVSSLNPDLATSTIDEALRIVGLADQPTLISNNQSFHRLLIDGVRVPIRREDGSEGYTQVRLVNWEDPDANDWLAVNQFAVREGKHHRRPDVVIFINGLPVAVIELKDPTDENATIWSAFKQLQTYKAEIPSLFRFNEMLVISDGLEARLGTLSADREWFMRWRTIEGETVAPLTMPQLEVLIRGVFEKRRFLDLLHHFIVFEEDKTSGTIAKKMAGYHQFHAVNTAVEETLRALAPRAGIREEEGHYFSRPQPGGQRGDRRVGVVWHTQGSGKSLSMVFYAGRLAVHPQMENPTIVVLTDRIDLDDQLFGTFSGCQDLLRQIPEQAESREHLRELLKRASGGVIFTTIHKFFPETPGLRHPALSERRNIVVIADEAHRSQYDFIDGYARHMRDALPCASFIGFTGTPIETTDANTRAVFGDYISVYDIQRAVEDQATVPIFYESR